MNWTEWLLIGLLALILFGVCVFLLSKKLGLDYAESALAQFMMSVQLEGEGWICLSDPEVNPDPLDLIVVATSGGDLYLADKKKYIRIGDDAFVQVYGEDGERQIE